MASCLLVSKRLFCRVRLTDLWASLIWTKFQSHLLYRATLWVRFWKTGSDGITTYPHGGPQDLPLICHPVRRCRRKCGSRGRHSASTTARRAAGIAPRFVAYRAARMLAAALPKPLKQKITIKKRLSNENHRDGRRKSSIRSVQWKSALHSCDPNSPDNLSSRCPFVSYERNKDWTT